MIAICWVWCCHARFLHKLDFELPYQAKATRLHLAHRQRRVLPETPPPGRYPSNQEISSGFHLVLG